MEKKKRNWRICHLPGRAQGVIHPARLYIFCLYVGWIFTAKLQSWIWKNGHRLQNLYISEWVEDVTKWPNRHWTNVLLSFLEKPSAYTLGKFKLTGHESLTSSVSSVVLYLEVRVPLQLKTKTGENHVWCLGCTTNKPANYILMVNCTCVSRK